MEGFHFVVFRTHEERSFSLRGQIRMRSVESCRFVVFRTDEEGSSLLRGRKCDVWKASSSLCLESLERDPLRCAVRNPQGNSLTVRHCATMGRKSEGNGNSRRRIPNRVKGGPPISGPQNAQIAILPTASLVKPFRRVSSDLARAILNALLS